MSQITAEMIERGRGANSRPSTERRRLAYKVREAREKLTTGGAGHGAFEGELLRIYAENRISSALWAVLIALAIAAERAADEVRDRGEYISAVLNP